MDISHSCLVFVSTHSCTLFMFVMCFVFRALMVSRDFVGAQTMDSPFRTSWAAYFFLPLLAYIRAYTRKWQSAVHFIYFIIFFFLLEKSILIWSCVLENNWSLVGPSWSLFGLSCSVAVCQATIFQKASLTTPLSWFVAVPRWYTTLPI